MSKKKRSKLYQNSNRTESSWFYSQVPVPSPISHRDIILILKRQQYQIDTIYKIFKKVSEDSKTFDNYLGKLSDYNNQTLKDLLEVCDE